MADTSFSLLLFLGTQRKFERTGLLGWGTLGLFTLELFQEALGMGSRGFLGIGALEFTFDLLRGTVFPDSKRRDWVGSGSWTQFRWRWWKGEVTKHEDFTPLSDIEDTTPAKKLLYLHEIRDLRLSEP